MTPNNKHQVADFDSIVEGELARATLLNLNLMPSSWDIPDDEKRRIMLGRLRIRAVEDLEDPNWPAFQNRGVVIFSSEAFESSNLSKDELLATLLHEVGHWVNPLPHMEELLAELAKVGSDQATKPANRDELYADDYASYCGLAYPLKTALQKLIELRKGFRSNSTRERIARLELDERPLLLNLISLSN